MILVSFSFAEEVLFYTDVNNYDTLRSQGTEHPPLPFFGTPGIGHNDNALSIGMNNLFFGCNYVFYCFTINIITKCTNN